MNISLKIYFIFCFILLHMTLPTRAYAATLERLDESSLDGLLPDYYFNHVGFKLPKDFLFPTSGIDHKTAPLPLFPMYKKQYFSRKFMGSVVPKKYLAPYLDFESRYKCESKGRSSKKDENVESGFFATGGAIPGQSNPAINSMIQQLRRIKLQDGLGFNVYYYNCELYVIPKNIKVVFGSETSFGLNLDLDLFGLFGHSTETFFIGERSTYGISLELGSLVTSLQDERGLNFGKSLNDVFHGLDMLVNGDNVERLIEKTMTFSPYISFYLHENSKNESFLNRSPLRNTESSWDELEAIYSGDFDLSADYQAPQLPLLVERKDFESELQNKLEDLEDPSILEKEKHWREALEPEINRTLIVNNVFDNELIQKICDYLFQVYRMPEDVHPKCKIAATWTPNAWASPGGDIFITAGLLGILSELDSVQLVLGHEIGHVVSRHTTISLPYFNAVLYTATGVATAMNLAATTFALGGGWGSLVAVNWWNWYPLAFGIGTIGNIPLGIAYELLFMGPIAGLMAYSRSNEWQADRFGHQAALASGAEQQRLYEGWKEFIGYVKKYYKPSSNILTWVFASHPDGDDRAKSLEKRYKKYRDALTPYQVKNRLDPTVYEAYRKMHSQYRTGSLKFGEYVQDKMKNQLDSRAQDYALKTLMSPLGKCIHYALEGVKD